MLAPRRAKKKKKQQELNQFELTITPIFVKNKECTSQIVANRGGGRSSKSWSLAQLMLERFFTYPKRQILILRKTLPSLRQSVLKDMNSIVDEMGVRKFIREEKQALNWYCIYNGSLIHYGGLDTPSKIKSTYFNDIWMEEATEFSYEDFGVLKTRLSSPIFGEDAPKNQMFLSFNPEDESCWIKEKVIDGPEDCTEIISSYKDNPFLSDEYRQLLENLIYQDRNHYRIYTLGEWGKLEAVIYTDNWFTTTKMPKEEEVDKVFYGIDFGYNDPSVLTKIMQKSKDLYIEECIYQSGLTNTDFAQLIRKTIPTGHARHCKLYCDNSEPDRIEELKREGLKAVPARKGPNSVVDGIDFLKRKRLNILKTSSNILKEIRTYSWKKDKKNNPIDEPIDYLNHGLDSIRYAVWTELGGSGGPKIWSIG